MLGSLDLFLLMLLRDGVNTPYTWSSRAGISLGASLPAVRRLIGRGLIREIAKGPRGRREFALTRLGENELKNVRAHLEDALREPPRDVESILRLGCCALASGRRQIGIELLRNSSTELEKRSPSPYTLKRPSDSLGEGGLAELYMASMRYGEAESVKASAKSLRSLASFFESLESAAKRVTPKTRKARR